MSTAEEKPFPGGVIGGGKGPAKAAPAKKAAASKAPAAPKPAKEPKEGSIVRAKSEVSKEGSQKCEFDGQEYPVTNFPTVKQKDGSYVRGTVARKNLEAWRAQRKALREAGKAQAALDKQAKKDAAAAEKAKAKEAPPADEGATA